MKTVKQRFTKHWKTTLAGIATSVILPVLDKIIGGEVSNRVIIASIASLLIGFILKDSK